MTEQASDAVQKVREVLDEIGRSLVTFDLDELLAAGPALESALTALERAMAAARPADGGMPDRSSVDLARQALLRCERLGRSLDDLTRISVSARNALLGLGYDRTGHERGPLSTAPSVEARV